MEGVSSKRTMSDRVGGGSKKSVFAKTSLMDDPKYKRPLSRTQKRPKTLTRTLIV